MSSCNFSIPFSGDISGVLAKVQSAIEGQKGMFDGNNSSGSFDVSVMSNTIVGNYAVHGQVIEISISKKPFFLPCNTIESFLKSKLT
ncbi:MAG: hypothetical protein M3015_07070 [Bacteroidota bacterium]|nr:hypothetical protein [Bacteroidota bacterium]